MRNRLRMLAALAATVSGAAVALAAGEPKKIVSPTEAWNHTWFEVLVDLWVIGGLFSIAAIYLLIKYRAKTPDAVGTAKPLSLELALAWALVPAAIFMADDFLLAAKGWSLWNVQRTVPPGAMEVKVTGSMWSFEFDYGNGVKDSDLKVPVGKPIVLRMTSNDVIHSFGLHEYRLKEDMMPGRITYIWFLPDKPLETTVTCVEFCGNSHSQMFSKVSAVPQADFDTWLNRKLERRRRAEAPAAQPAATKTAN